jgi:serine/threonine-protein kinase
MARRRSDPSLEIPIELGSTGEIVIPAALSADPIGRIGRYEVLGRIAVGGMAEIYLAREDAPGASRILVVKVVRPQLADDTDFGDMFLHEGRVALALKHPSICHTYEFGVDGRRYFMAMEYVHGVTLREAMRRAASRGERLPPPVALKIVAHVAEALDSAHRTRDHAGRMGVVHRDVTPQNIMIGFDGVVKLLDFGIAQAQGDPTRGGQTRLEGKLAYLAPEQIRKKRVDGRSDIFSLGVCLYEVLTGRPLFKRKTDLDTL